MGCLLSTPGPKPVAKQSQSAEPVPMKTKAVEAKIIALAKTIKDLVKPPSDANVGNKPRSDVTEEKVTDCFKEIIVLAKKCSALDGNVLNEVLMACNTLRINNPDLAHKMSYLSTTSKKLVEERTIAAEEINTPDGSSQSSMIGSPKMSHTNKSALKAGQATLVSQVPLENKTLSSTTLRKLTSDGLPPLKDFKKKADFADGSQHSGDFGFFDLSVHDRTGMPEWQGIVPPTQDASPKMPPKMHYSVSQLNVANHQ